MLHLNQKGLFISSFILFTPSLLFATRGPQDYGIVMVIMFIIFTFPFGLATLTFNIYLISLLRDKKKPKKNDGKVVFIISLVIIPISIFIPLIIVHGKDWHPTLAKLMAADFIPVLLMASSSAVLAQLVKRRALSSDNAADGESSITDNQSFFLKNRQALTIGSIVILLALVIFLFRYFFM